MLHNISYIFASRLKQCHLRASASALYTEVNLV